MIHGGGREDIEIRALIDGATTGLSGATPEWRIRSRAPSRGPRWIVLLLAISALAVPARLAFASGSDGGPAGVSSTDRFISGTASSGLLVTTVPSSGIVDPQAAALAMQTSQRNAVIAAMDCAGTTTPPEVALRSDGVVGPSAGLMLAIAIVDEILATDATRGVMVAGTGTIAPDGIVEAVGAVAEKARLAEEAGADLFLAPIAQVHEAERAAQTMRVVGVGHLSDALHALTGTGCND